MNLFLSLFEEEDSFEGQVKAGTKEEMKHTDDPKEAEKIARDHMKEDPHYYTKLAKCGLMKKG